jgi:outer membrane biosynthesis protein TonB
MAVKRQFAVVLVALGLLLGAGCEKQKPQLPAKMQAPTLPVQVADQIPEEEPPHQEPAQQQIATVEEPAPKKAPPKHKNAKKPTQPPPANQASSTVAVNHPPANAVIEPPAASAPPATDTAIAADVNSQTLTDQKQKTADLLDSTEKDLKGLNRSLSHDEEVMLTQIKSYVQQSHKATTDGDFERAYNLALKAHLLSDALTKK